MILVTGGTGNAGAAVIRALVSSGERVRGLVRDAAGAALPPGVEAVVGDLNVPETVAPHLEGVTAAFLLSGYGGLEETLANMRRAGVERVVLLSSSAAPSGDETNAVARYHIRSERAVRQSGLGWTFLQPNTFMTNTFQWLPQMRSGDVIRAAFADVRVATIDPDDIGAVAALALTSDRHEGRAYRLSGPESLSPADRVAILGEVLGRPLRFEPQTNDEARAEMSATMPAEYVDAFFRFFVDGELDESAVLPTVEELTGRAPRSFAAWARAHADAFG
jgi:uncharacterized protein YbjT (DUF2867 family)